MSTRDEWLASLKVGDKIAWVQSGRIRRIYVIERETPKHWVIADGWLVTKKAACSAGVMSGVWFHPYVKGMEATQARQERSEDMRIERCDLLARISRFSTKRLRAIATKEPR